MVHNTTWLTLVVWLLCTVPVNAHPNQSDRCGDGGGWHTTLGNERVVDPELGRWDFDDSWYYGIDLYEGNWLKNGWGQTNPDRDLFGDFELRDSELLELDFDSGIDWNWLYLSGVGVCNCERCVKDWQRKKTGERKMIDENILYCLVGFGAGVVCHRFVMAALSKAFGWMSK
jgi:hypothetical protein